MASKAEFSAPMVDSKECIVEGVIETKYVKALEVLLHGISGNQKKDVKVHEIVLKSERGLGIGSQEVRLRCSLEEPEPLWTVFHIGGALRGATSDKIAVLVRNRDDSRVSNNALRFFDLVGYKFDHELLRVGFVFNAIQKVVGMEGINKYYEITVSVTSIHKIPKKFEIDKAEPLTPGVHLVEVYTVSTADNYTEAANAITAFSEMLAPIIHLSKPGFRTGVPSTAAAAASSIMSRGNRRVP